MDLVESWIRDARPPASEHARLEIAHAVHTGHSPGEPPPLETGDPVPGCPCVTCRTLAAGANAEGAALAVDVVRDLRRVGPDARLQLARSWVSGWAAEGVVLPDPAALVRIARDLDPRLRRRRREGSRLPVEDARRVSILDVVARLGLGEPVGRWGEPRVRCPFHDDHDPSLRLNVDAGLWYCDPCMEGGDGIDLWQRVRGVRFADAVREMAA